MGNPLRRTSMIVAISLLALSSSRAQSPASEPALARGAQDLGLTWGPCPEFMPKGCGIAVLHGDPGKPNADIFFKVPGGSEIAEHWHSSAERMVLVSGEMHVTYRGQEKVVLKPGLYAYGPAKASHEASCVSSEPCVLFIAFESPVDAVAGASSPK